MIKVQVIGLKNIGAILAAKTVPLKKVLAIELHLPNGKPVISAKKKHIGNTKGEVNCLDTVRWISWWVLLRKIDPASKIHYFEGAVTDDDLRVILKKEAKPTLDPDNIHRLP
jgi:hypothetical protein